MRTNALARPSRFVAACAGPAPNAPGAGSPADALRDLERRLAEAEHVACRATVIQRTPQEDWAGRTG